MSEVEARPQPTRGRGSGRGGRGGFSSRGSRGSRKPANGTTQDAAAPEASIDEQGEIGEMKRKYMGELPLLKDMFKDWTDVDLLFALQECDGDLPATVDRITQGSVSQFSEVKSAKDRARSRVKEEPATGHVPSEKAGAAAARGGRGRGDASRGRGRATERGRGAHRGRGGHATTNGTSTDPATASVPTTESPAWNTEPTAAPTASWDTQTADKPAPAPESAAKKTWASMFSAPKPVAKSAAQDAPSLSAETASQEVTTPAALVSENTQPALLANAMIEQGISLEEASIPPPKDPLTVDNVEHLPDESHPPATHTAASTVGSNDPRNLTPLPGQPAPIGRPPLGGFQTSAMRAASGSLRANSYQRRVQEQAEAVVMPGHNAVDRATVQFGSMGLNGEPGADVDDEREQPETRQAHQHSPPSAPKASLPPAPRQTTAIDNGLPEANTAKPPGLPPASQQNQPPQESALTQGLHQDPAQHNYQQSQYSGYGHTGQQDAQSQQKPYDPFAYQTHQQQYDRFGQTQAQQQQPPQQHAGFGGLSSAPHDYSSYYTADAQRNPYNQYYGSSSGYGADTRQHGQQQDSHAGQRAASGYTGAPADSSYGAQSQQQTQARYAEGANSGHNTPNPPSGQQHGAPGAQQSNPNLHQQAQQQQQYQQNAYPGATPGFPYGHPYFNSPYQQAYQNQFGYSQYGASYPTKQSGMHGSPQGYNMGGQSSYEHSSASNAAAYNQQQRNTSGMSSGLNASGNDDYSRASSHTTSQQAGSNYGSINDPFARTPSGFGQSSYGTQNTSGAQEESLKPFADNKTGASPALGQPGRPGSAANNPAASQSSLPPTQQGYGGYQGYPNQTSQYGGLGGLGGHQQTQNTQGSYGQYNAGAFSQYGGNYNNSRGGWGQSYGAH